MSLDPDLRCQYCGSADLFEDAYWNEDEITDVDVFCNLCYRKVM
jgi:hypothetical protein